MRYVSLIAPVVSLFAVACVSPGISSFRYTPPGLHELRNEEVVSQPFDDVWNHLVSRLAQTFFVINNIDKNSRIINVSFSTDEPSRYIDCGTTDRHFLYRHAKENYEYKVASSSTYKAASKWGPYKNLPAVANINRVASMDGRANIYIAPSEGTTHVVVNVRYVLTVSITGTAYGYNVFGTLVQQQGVPAQAPLRVSFTTHDHGRTIDQDQAIVCESKGTLESELLSYARTH